MSLNRKIQLLALAWLTGVMTVIGASAAKIEVVRAPEGGIQPQGVVDGAGVIHLIYFKGTPKGGDVFYVKREPKSSQFSKPIQVNSNPGSAIAIGTIRGAHIALGKNGRAHVSWMGGSGATPAKMADGEATPMVYARMKDDGTGFEPERNVLTYAAGLDGGGSIAADKQGNVYVAWHASKPGNTEGEIGRAVYIAHSRDDGKTFMPERLATPERTGACGCCGMRAFADENGALYVLYRGASDKMNREQILMVSKKTGQGFTILNKDNWSIPACPMSSAAFSEDKERTLAAWETEGKVFYAPVDKKTLKMGPPVTPDGSIKRKHPVAAGNSAGETLLVWTEGTGWQRGGSVAWQLFDANGKSLDANGRKADLPVWGMAAAFAQPDGSFLIVY